MMGLPQARWIAWGLIFLLSAFSTEAIPAIEADVAPSASQDTTDDGTQNFFSADKRFIVALGDPAPPVPRSASLAPSQPPPASSQWPATARFFTINQVLAKHKQTNSSPSPLHLAAIDPKAISDASSSATLSNGQSDEPFGLFTFKAPDGLLWAKWRKVETDIQAEAPALARCRADADHCNSAEARFIAIVKQAEMHQGRAKLAVVNERVNAVIRYTTDMMQWAALDVWSAPLDTNNKGSFNTGIGDCEDYAIAKYVALREAGVPAGDLRLLLVRDNAVRLDHAVLAARQDDRWLILDNRHNVLLESKDARFFTPLFALDQQGVKLFAAPYAASSSIQVAAASTPAKAADPMNGAAQVNSLAPAAAEPLDASSAHVYAAGE